MALPRAESQLYQWRPQHFAPGALPDWICGPHLVMAEGSAKEAGADHPAEAHKEAPPWTYRPDPVYLPKQASSPHQELPPKLVTRTLRGQNMEGGFWWVDQHGTAWKCCWHECKAGWWWKPPHEWWHRDQERLADTVEALRKTLELLGPIDEERAPKRPRSTM